MKKNILKLTVSLALGAMLAFLPVGSTQAVTVSVGPDTSSSASSSSSLKITVKRAMTGKVGIIKGKKYKLKAKASKGKLSYKSSKKKVVTVSKKGVLKAKKLGKATITVTAKSGSKKATKKIKVTVFKKSKFKHAKSLRVSVSHSTLAVGSSGKVSAKVSPKGASNKNVVFKSSNSSVLAVSASGKVTAKKVGKAKVSVTSCETSVLKTTVTIKVKKSTKTTTKTGDSATPSYEPDKKVSVPSIANVSPKASLSSYSWGELKSIANAISACASKDSATELAKEYKLVDSNGKISATNTKPVTVTFIQNLGKVQKWTETHYVHVLGYWHDAKTGGGKAGLTFGFKDLVTFRGFNVDASNSGGWKASAARTYLNGTFCQMLPGDVRTLVEKVDKKTNNTGGKTGGKTSVVSTTSDKVWLPSAVEVYGDLATFGQEHPSIAAYPAVLNAEGSQYELFSGNAVKPAGSSLCKKTYKAESGTEEHFWRLRSAHADDAELALIVDKDGALNRQSADSRYGLAPAFCF